MSRKTRTWWKRFSSSDFAPTILLMILVLPLFLRHGSMYMAGILTGLLVLNIFAWLGEQWPRKFKRWTDPSEYREKP